MNEIASYVTSFTWWFTAVIVAIIVNLVSSYIRDGTDWVWRYAKRKLEVRETTDARTKRIAESNAAFLEQLKTDESLRRFLVEAEVRARLVSLELLILGTAFAALGYYSMGQPQQFLPSLAGQGMGYFSLVVLFAGMQQYSLAHGLSKALIDVERSRRPEILDKGR